MRNNIFNWMKLSSFIFALSSLFASCSNELDDTLQPVENGTLQFVIGDFPAFGEGAQTRAIGTQDEGKTAWENGDKILVTLISQKYGEQAVALTYNGSSWSTEASLSYLENETPTVNAVYAPCYEVTVEGVKQLRSGMQLGMCEYLEADCEIQNGTINISFADALRTYSRLRIAGLSNQTLTVTTMGFTPAGATTMATDAYTLTADDKGNAYLYGVFAEGATVTVKQGDITLKDYTFTAEKNPNGTEPGKSYALQAGLIIDGTFGGKPEVTDDEVTALTNTIKEYVKSGCSAIFVTGSEMAIHYNGYYDNYPAYADALYYVTDGSTITEFNGKVDLILPDATKLVKWEFDSHYCLKSITLPKVTTIGESAFYSCFYVETLTFGSVITSVGNNAFSFLGDPGSVTGGKPDLVLNCGQMEGNYIPDIDKKEWCYDQAQQDNYTWKSITLTHTGDCDECKKLQ